MVDDDITTTDLRLRAHSWRNYEPLEFVAAAQNDGRIAALDELRAVEAGRFETMLDQTWAFFEPLDEDERQEWAARNQGMMDWVAVFAWLSRRGLPLDEYASFDLPDRLP